MDRDDDGLRDKLAAHQARLRWRLEAIWLVFVAVLLGGGVVGWLATGKEDQLWGGIFYSAFPLVGWVYTRFRLIPTGRDPTELDSDLRRRDREHMRNAGKIAVRNGWMLLVSSILLAPFFVLIGAEDGWAGAVLGGAVGGLWGFGGLASIRWGRRTLRTWDAG